MIVAADARTIPLATNTVHTVITSPPYWGRRLYGDHPDELGIEDLHVYIATLAGVFDEVARVLRPDGTAWLNIGDTAAGSGGAGGDYNAGGAKAGKPKYRQGRPTVPTGELDLLGDPVLAMIPNQSWCDVPGLVAAALKADGWLVRADITWDKGGRRPEDLGHVRRPGESSERIFMLTRSMRYRFWPERLAEPGNVWHFAPGKRSGPAHLAPFPDELARRCITPCTEPGDLVLDPFVGSGTVVKVAGACGRRAVGIDLYAGRNT